MSEHPTCNKEAKMRINQIHTGDLIETQWLRTELAILITF